MDTEDKIVAMMERFQKLAEESDGETLAYYKGVLYGIEKGVFTYALAKMGEGES